MSTAHGQPRHRHRRSSASTACSSGSAPRRSAGPRLLAAKTARRSSRSRSCRSCVLVRRRRWRSAGTRRSTRPAVVAAVVLGTVAFAGLGLLMAGTLRGEVTLAAANGLYLVLLLLGGMVVPARPSCPARCERSPSCCPRPRSPRRSPARSPRGVDVPGRAWLVLAAWAVGAPRRGRAHRSAGSSPRASAAMRRPVAGASAAGRSVGAGPSRSSGRARPARRPR